MFQAGALCFERSDGEVHPVDTRSFIEALAAGVNLRCVILNGCCTLPVARHILAARPDLQVLCWATMSEDRAAIGLSKAFFGALGQRGPSDIFAHGRGHSGHSKAPLANKRSRRISEAGGALCN